MNLTYLIFGIFVQENSLLFGADIRQIQKNSSY